MPEGILNIVNGYGVEVGRPLATNPRIAKIAFTGSTAVGQLIMQYATENIIPVTLELGVNLRTCSLLTSWIRKMIFWKSF